MQKPLTLIANEDLPELFRLRSQPKQKRTKEAFNRILDAAIDLAFEQGLAAINTNMIADKAGLDIASLYRIFPNKEAIFYWDADRWLSNIRSICDQMNSDDYRHLTWQAFFAKHGDMISQMPEYQKAYAPLMPLWASYLEFQQMLSLHYAYMTRFFVKHLQRFGATESKAKLEHLVNYLMVSSDALHDIAPAMSRAREKAFYRLDYETWMFHLSRVLPSEK